MPFRPLRPNPNIAALLSQRGDILAGQAARSGQIWGNTVNQLGQLGAGVVEGIAQKKAVEEQQAALDQRAQSLGQLMQDPEVFKNPGYAMNALMQAGYSPEESFNFAKGFKTFGEAMQGETIDPEKAIKQAQTFAGIYVNADPASRQQFRPGLEQWAQRAGLDPNGELSGLDEDTFLQQAQALIQPSGGAKVGSPEWLLSASPEDVQALGERERLREGPQGEKKYKVTVNGVTKLVPESQLEEGIREDRPAASGEQEWFLDTDTGTHVLRTKQEARAAGDRYQRPLWAAQGIELERVQRNLAAFTDINTSLAAVTDKVGPVNYTLNELQQKLPERYAEAQPAFRAFQQQLNALTNEEIKRITGAQMSAQEADRLKKGMATGSLKLDDLKAALYIWQRSMERTQASLMGRLDKWQEESPFDPQLGNLFGSPDREPSPGVADKAIGWITSFFSGGGGGEGSADNPIVLE